MRRGITREGMEQGEGRKDKCGIRKHKYYQSTIYIYEDVIIKPNDSYKTNGHIKD